jgi:hypothetical protein
MFPALVENSHPGHTEAVGDNAVWLAPIYIFPSTLEWPAIFNVVLPFRASITKRATLRWLRADFAVAVFPLFDLP